MRTICKLNSLNPVSDASCCIWPVPAATTNTNGTGAASAVNSLKGVLSRERTAGFWRENTVCPSKPACFCSFVRLGDSRRVNLSWPASIYGYHLQSTSNLLGNVWADLPATVTQTNGFNLATVPSTANSQFFRLVLPPQ